MKKLVLSLIEKRMHSQNKLFRKVLSVPVILYLNAKGSYFGSRAIYDGRPIFPHGINGILISSGANIGKGSIIFHQVTIGSNTTPGSSKNGSPTIGDNCYIGAGAKIIGNITIGDNVRIGANAVVVKDVPDNAVVVNQPSRIIVKDQNDNSWRNVNKI